MLLAGVTIASITGENGILNKAVKAKNSNIKATAEEKVEIGIMESYDNDGILNLDNLNNKLKNIDGLKYNGNVISDNNKIEKLPSTVNVDGYDVTIDKEGKIEQEKSLEEAKSNNMLLNNKDVKVTVSDGVVIIPAGFKVASDSGETKDEGIVIEDCKKNQFVWVPVSKENFETEFVRREGYKIQGSLDNVINYCGEANAEGINDKVEETETTQEEAKKMYASVKRNEGFYIARYEAGKDSNGNVVFQKNADVYNKIPWSANGDSMQETTGTTGGAVELSRNFANANNYKTVTSTLIYGVQWDTVMNWMKDVINSNSTTADKRFIAIGTGMGWYNENFNLGNSNHRTGIDIGEENKGLNKVKNIYDIAGNVREWTMESNLNNRRISRSGDFGGSGANYPASNRSAYEPSSSIYIGGFRSTLYLNN